MKQDYTLDELQAEMTALAQLFDSVTLADPCMGLLDPATLQPLNKVAAMPALDAAGRGLKIEKAADGLRASYRNCVFVGKDEYGVARCAFQRGCQGTFRGDVSGSQKQYGFLISAEDPACDTVEIYEAPIDAMSGATLRQYKHDMPWRGVHYLALGGLNHQPIEYFLSQHPHVKTVVLCFDRDEPGRNFAGTVAKKLTEKNLVVVDMPPAVGKDYNEYLLAAKKLISMER